MKPRHTDKEPLLQGDVPAVYKQAIKDVAVQWPENIPQYTETAGSRNAYREMGQILSERMKDAGVPKRVTESLPHHSGIEVVRNFFYTGAAKAALIGFSISDLRAALYQPESFRQLVPLTKEVSDSARDMEVHLGLTDYGGSRLNSYHLSDKGLTIRTDDYMIAQINGQREAARIADYKGLELPGSSEDIRCTGMKSGLVTYAYRYMLDICMVDPALFHATLDTHQATDTPLMLA